jgi:hypothetical protein
MPDGNPVYHFERTLTFADNKQVIRFPFDVPPGCERLEITLRYAPERAGGIENLLVPALFDPAGCRGTGHRGGAMKRVVVEESRATPGFLAGPLTPGRWGAEVEVHLVMPDEACRLTLDIIVSPDEAPDAAEIRQFAGLAAAGRAAQAQKPLGHGVAPNAPGWYRGDLHTHTVHSDGHIDVTDRILAAEEQGLDFFFLTDHNTVSGLVELGGPNPVPAKLATPFPTREGGSDPGTGSPFPFREGGQGVTSGSRLLPLGGMELTTFYGHALCLGAREWIDWRVRPGDGGMAAIAQATEQAGLLFIIAHPCSVDDPYCTGCAWHYDEVSPGPARAVEVWNGPWAGDSGNEENLSLWYAWLNRGQRVVGTAGSDAHEGYGDAQGLGFCVVYAEAMSQAGLLDGIRRGHLYLSAGPRLDLSATPAVDEGESTVVGSRRPAMIGDRLDLGEGQTAEFSVSWEECPAGAELRVIVDGQPRLRRPVGQSGQYRWRLQAGEAHWCLVEVRHADGNMLALTNPIFL